MTTTSGGGWILRHCTSLRRHDPDQLLTVGVTPSQPALAGSRVANARGSPTGCPGRRCDNAAVTDFADRLRPPAARRPVPRLRPAARRARARGRARAGARRRRRHRPAARQAGVARRAAGRRRDRAPLLRRGRRAAHPQRPPRPRARRPAPTAATSARTTWTRPTRARWPATGRSSGSRRTSPTRSTPPTDADYIGVGPVLRDADEARPARRSASSSCASRARTRPCRSSRSAASTPSNVDAVVEAGARRIAVVRAITEAADPRAAAAALRAAVGGERIDGIA